jgi:hypothetical protein
MTMASDKVEWAYDGDVWHGDIVSTAFGDYVALYGNDEWTEDRRRFVRRDEVKRIEDIPPEPRDARVLYDRDDTPWMRNESLGRWVSRHSAESYRTLVRDRGPLYPYPRAAREEIERLTAKVAEGQRLVEEMAPVLIERDVLTAQLADAKNAGTDIAEERDVATAENERLTRELEVAIRLMLRSGDRAVDAAREAVQQKRRADELQRRIDRAIRQLEGFGRDFSVRALAILRGEADQ